MKSGFVAIVGKPNAGKSTLINKIINKKISIVSDKEQTTRKSIIGVYNKKDLQIVFVDTPGIHDPKSNFGTYMNKVSFNEANGCDVIYYLFDIKKGMDKEDFKILNKLIKYNIPIFCLVNKIDLVSKKILIERLQYANEKYSFAEIFPISAYYGDNINDLLNTTKTYLNSGPKYYSDDVLDNVSNEQKVSEEIRESLLRNLDKEVPHLIAVVIDTYNESSKKITVEASIIVNKESHKGIVLGKKGSMLNKINMESTSKIEKLLSKKVVLSLFVKVVEDWVNNDKKLFEFGYYIDKK